MLTQHWKVNWFEQNSPCWQAYRLTFTVSQTRRIRTHIQSIVCMPEFDIQYTSQQGVSYFVCHIRKFKITGRWYVALNYIGIHIGRKQQEYGYCTLVLILFGLYPKFRISNSHRHSLYAMEQSQFRILDTSKYGH